jgi:ATP-dependent 26S proteasome regulatory subunit
MPPTATVALLEEVEALYREKVAVALTLMTGDEPPKLQGLRPGRADETFEFSPPGAEGRLALLQAYAPNFSWEGTAGDARAEGMTPAYLKELARRVIRGENPEAALISLHKHRAIAN